MVNWSAFVSGFAVALGVGLPMIGIFVVARLLRNP